MKYAFKTYDQFLDVNMRNGRTLSRTKAIQIRKLWKEKEIAGEQWWALYVSYSNKREEKGTVNDIFGDILSFSTYLTNPGALIKVFEDINNDESNIKDNSFSKPKPNSKVFKQVKDKVESLGGKVLGTDDDNCDEYTRYKVNINGNTNWYTYSYIINRL